MSLVAINPGHVLVVPRVHEPDFHRLDPRIYQEVFSLAQKLAGAIDKAYRPKKVGLLVAGFDVPHTHVHVLPMHDYHDITSRQMLDGSATDCTPTELDKEATALRSALDALRG